MINRDIEIKKIRLETLGEIHSITKDEERFQNETLRPILKFQNDILIQVFKNYLMKQKSNFDQLTPIKKFECIDHAIQKDIKFRNSLKGMVIGLFTIDEFECYKKNSSNLNKRMMNLIAERLKNNVMLF